MDTIVSAPVARPKTHTRTRTTRRSMASIWAMLVIGMLATIVALLAQAPAPVHAGSHKFQALSCSSSSSCNPKYLEFCDKSRGEGVCALSQCSIESSDLSCRRYNETTYCDTNLSCVQRLPEGSSCPINLQSDNNWPCQVGLFCDPYTKKCITPLTFFEAHEGLVIGVGFCALLLITLITIWVSCCCCGCCRGCCRDSQGRNTCCLDSKGRNACCADGCCNERYVRGEVKENESVPPAAAADAAVAYPQPPLSPPPYTQPASASAKEAGLPTSDMAASSSSPSAGGGVTAPLYMPADSKKPL
ncbi:hypothetical protein AMAG_07588 [Allomyces macrogynus ATCC 38327]|uniref:Uncharacterized protein n=1 Tax=Allomyces macrogynus (strain ATCC 38327) TaxID=578462 RepID=A0A0L0SIR1_ALLM3|nr:hypothetical protein AMAG_07588 [Allomyces macrogynus ATCC 38327]|eukprot:KNE62362.1 hypothetical protein AMAG_07588 [Allomyces macrogynus ATCC 38327]